MIIYRSTDKVPVKIGELKIWISPLSYGHKQALASFTRMEAGESKVDTQEVVKYTLRACIKRVEGVSLADGSAYEPDFDENGMLTEESMHEVLQLGDQEKILTVVAALAREVKDHQIEGVEIDLKGIEVSKKKR